MFNFALTLALFPWRQTKILTGEHQASTKTQNLQTFLHTSKHHNQQSPTVERRRIQLTILPYSQSWVPKKLRKPLCNISTPHLIQILINWVLCMWVAVFPSVDCCEVMSNDCVEGSPKKFWNEKIQMLQMADELMCGTKFQDGRSLVWCWLKDYFFPFALCCKSFSLSTLIITFLYFTTHQYN